MNKKHIFYFNCPKYETVQFDFGTNIFFLVCLGLFGFVEKWQIPLVELVESFIDFGKLVRREPVG